MKLDEVVKNYIALRDRKAAIKAEYDAKAAKIDAVLDKAEAKILEYFEQSGLESIRTDKGTAYKSTLNSATVGDWDSVLAHVLETENYQLLEHRVRKKAVEEYRMANEDLPPGVNWRSEVTVNVRRG